jgi:hypothetical protein
MMFIYHAQLNIDLAYADIVAAKEGIAADRAYLANEANKASFTEANKLLANNNIAIVIKYFSKLLLSDGIAINLFLYLPFSPTKYSAIFAEVKGYIGIGETPYR